MRRRDFVALAMLSLTGIGRATAQDPSRSAGPHFSCVIRGKSQVFLLGIGEAKDESWLRPSIRQAFERSSSLWLEVGASDSPEAAAQVEQLGHEQPGQSFFEVLQPAVRARALSCMNELGIKRETVETLRPWRAYYVFTSAFFSKRTLPYKPVLPDEFLTERAVTEHKTIQYEMPSRLSFAQFMAGMSDKAQNEYIEWLLDFLDDYKNGLNGEKESLGWIHGDFTAENRSLSRMRKKMPELYAVMQVRRNGWWAQKITELLQSEGTHFIAVGNLHAMGPDGIPAQLGRLGIAMQMEESRSSASAN